MPTAVPEAEAAMAPVAAAGKVSKGPSPRTSTVTEIRRGRAARPDRGLSLGDLMLEALRGWQHRTQPAQVSQRPAQLRQQPTDRNTYLWKRTDVYSPGPMEFLR